MSDISNRFCQALEFVVSRGFARSESAIARKLGVTAPAISMAKSGEREPSWEMLLNFCDHYPINFWWLRSGEGDMIGNGDRVVSLLQQVKELEKRLGL